MAGFSWKLLHLLEQYCQSHLMNLTQLIDCWRADDEFSQNNFYLIVVKEFWYGKKELEVFWRIFLNIIVNVNFFSGLKFEYYCE